MDEDPLRSNIAALVHALDGHIPDDDTRSRLSVDLRDLAEASCWFLSTLESVGSRPHTDDEFQGLLIDLEGRYLDCATHHISSLRRALWAVLATFPDSGDGEGAAVAAE